MADLIVESIGNAAAEEVATTYVVNGAAKMWSTEDGTAGTVVAADSLNLSSITDLASGVYQHNMANAMSSADYMAVGGSSESYTVAEIAASRSTSHVSITCRNTDATGGTDSAWVTVCVMGDLA